MPQKSKPKLIVVLGPTASGKIYRGLDIGSGKITKREMRGISHHLLDVANPKRQFSVVQYHRLATRTIEDILKRSKVPILCGGTGFYIDAVLGTTSVPEVPPDHALRKKLEKKSVEELFKMLRTLDPRRAKDIDEKNPRRLIRAIEIARALGSVPPLETKPSPYDVLSIGLTVNRDTLREKISARLTKRMKKGMLAEGRRLHAAGLSWKRMRALGLEYRAMADLLTGITTRTEMTEKLTTEICQYAKRQMTWFQRDKNIKWFKPAARAKILKEVKKFLKV
jgi:tRNA dimethylallyltransferase